MKKKKKPFVVIVAVVVSAILALGGFLFVFWDFGFSAAALITVIIGLPLVIAVCLILRWRHVRVRELVFFLILFCVAAGGSTFVVHDWYSKGLHEYHAEDMRWLSLERQLRSDPAFQDVVLHKSRRKNIHWASGTVDSEAELIRLHAIAAECGISGRLDGPYVHSVSLTVRHP